MARMDSNLIEQFQRMMDTSQDLLVELESDTDIHTIRGKWEQLNDIIWDMKHISIRGTKQLREQMGQKYGE